MKNFLIILLMLGTTGCLKSQSGYLGNNATPFHSLIIFNGESNSGGFALNSDALSWEIGVRDSVKILNNTTLLFESLNIGVNNLIGHNGLGPWWYTAHGWELELADAIDSGTLPRPVYLVKTGQGGSISADWIAPSFPYPPERFVRIDTARSFVRTINGGTAPQLYIFYSLGINDAIANTDTATWHANIKTWFADVRARYGFVPIFMTKIPVAYAKYNITIANICSEISDCYPIETSDCPLQGDGIHWTYSGMKTIATRMIYTLKAHYTYY